VGKNRVRLLLFVLVSVFLFSTATIGAEDNAQLTTDWGYITPYGGISYNTYNLDKLNEYVEPYNVEEITSGVAFYLGARHWFAEDEFLEDAALGFEFERMSISYDDIDISASNMGFLLTGAYRPPELTENMPLDVRIVGGGGFYRGSLSEFIVDDDSFWGPGFKVGLEADYSVTDDIKLGGRAGYRYSNPHSEGDLDFSGFELAVQAVLDI